MTSPTFTTKSILRHYISEQTPARVAIRQLQKLDRLEGGNPEAVLMAADINLQEATTPNSQSAAQFQAARIGYLSLMESVQAPYTHRAALRLAQMPVYHSIFNQSTFLDRESAVRVHNNTVSTAKFLVDSLKHCNRKYFPIEVRQDAAGTLAEMAVLSLFQHYAIVSQIEDCWFPVQARLKEDHGEFRNFNSRFKNGWDISIFTSDNREKLALTYPVQVKKSNRIYRPYTADIIKVTVDQDLNQGPTNNISSDIINDLLRIRVGGGERAKAMKRINLQAEMAIQKLEK